MNQATGFGALVRAARVKSGVTQIALANAIGRAHSHISNIENGYVAPTAEEIERICEFLKIGEPFPDQFRAAAGSRCK